MLASWLHEQGSDGFLQSLMGKLTLAMRLRSRVAGYESCCEDKRHQLTNWLTRVGNIVNIRQL
jgi:hypothetical protein